MKEETLFAVLEYFRHRPSTEQSCWPQDKPGRQGRQGAAIIQVLSQWSNLSLSCEAGRDVCMSVVYCTVRQCE